MPRRSATKPLPNPDIPSLSALEQILGHTFRRPELLTLALTHRSFVYDAALTPAPTKSQADLADPSRDNEQLEFVGDAALGLLAAEALCRRFPASREGELTRLRASVVSRKHLGEVGTRLDLGRWLRLGHTAEKNSGRSNPALLANAIEALIAALYLDGGIEAARRFVESEILTGALPEADRPLAPGEQFSGTVGDHKSALQEMLQAQGLPRPRYHVLEESGPDHRRLFRIEVTLEDGKTLAQAEGTTKKQAQQEAARLAVAKLLAEPQPGGAAA
jgi:ribonuclease-3